MQKNIAHDISHNAFAMGRCLDSITTAVNEIENEELRRKYLNSVESIMEKICFDLIYPIVYEYPDLNQDK
jgi:hypothetical protein